MTQEDKAYKNLMDALEPEQPSMRFSKNVMDAIGGMEVAPVGKRYVNSLVVKGIVAMLILCMFVSLYVVFTNAGSLPEYTNQLPIRELPQNFSLYLLGINIVLLMILAERWLSSKRRIKDLQNNA